MPNIADFKSKLEAEEIESRLVGGVVFNKDMSGKMSEEEKAIARNNIGATAFGQGIKIVSHYDTLAQLEAAVPKPKPGDAYSVGAALPYNLYIFDLLDGSWKDYGPIRSADISARLAQNVTVSSAAWEEDNAVFADYHYKARIPLGEINGGDFAFVGFSPHDATAGNFSPMCFSFDGAVEIWARAIPDAAILIPSISFIVLPDNSGAASTKGITNACGGVGTAGVTNAMLAKNSVTADKLAPGSVAKVYTATIHTDWEGDSAPYTQTILVDGLPASDRIFADIAMSEDYATAEAEVTEFIKIFSVRASTGMLNVTATDKTELPLNIKLFVFHGNGMGTGGNGGSGEDEPGSGEPGEPGFSPIANVTQTADGAVITITDKDGTTTATVSNGKDGNGIKYAALNADYTLTLTFDDGTSCTTPSIRGATGATGGKGADGVGIASIKQTTTSTADDGNNVFTVTLTNGTTATFTVQNGSKGNPGTNGTNGTSVTVKSVSESTADGGSNVVTFSDGKAVTIKNGSKGEKGDKGDKGDKGSTGATGERGTSILNIATAPSSYTTATGGFTPTYRISLSTVLSESKAAKVLVGDTLRYSYYVYPVGYVDASYVYCGTSVSIRGATGAAGAAGSDATVTVESIVAALGYVPVGPGTNSPLTGKKIVYDGDSICAASFGYPKLIADKTACIFENQAVGGGRLCANSERHSVVNNLSNLSTDGDIYCFQGGINDWWGNTPVGTFSQGDYTGTVDPATIYGAMETIFRYALTNFFGKAICFVITHKVQNAAYSKNTAGLTFWDYRKAMIDVCEKYSIPYYDAFTKSGLNGWHAEQKAGFFVDSDGTHPTEAAYEAYYVPQLIKLFESFTPVGDYKAPAKPVTYTNVLKNAVGADGQPYNGGAGFKENFYLNSSSVETASTNYDVTGFIRVNPGDVVRFKNVQVCKIVNGNTKCQIHYFDANFGRLGNSDYLKAPTSLSEAWSVVANADGTDIVQFTIPTALGAIIYMRMCCGTLTDASVITINEEID